MAPCTASVKQPSPRLLTCRQHAPAARSSRTHASLPACAASRSGLSPAAVTACTIVGSAEGEESRQCTACTSARADARRSAVHPSRTARPGCAPACSSIWVHLRRGADRDRLSDARFTCPPIMDSCNAVQPPALVASNAAFALSNSALQLVSLPSDKLVEDAIRLHASK
eukprot:191332-Pleurochrysis_carterae.AAC.1